MNRFLFVLFKARQVSLSQNSQEAVYRMRLRYYNVSTTVSCRFGQKKSLLWLQSLFFSFIQCVFITHPILVSQSVNACLLDQKTYRETRSVALSSVRLSGDLPCRKVL